MHYTAIEAICKNSNICKNYYKSRLDHVGPGQAPTIIINTPYCAWAHNTVHTDGLYLGSISHIDPSFKGAYILGWVHAYP